MIKSFSIYILAFSLLLIVSLNLHLYILDKSNIYLRFEIRNIYIFFALASFILCLVFFGLNSMRKAQEQLGFLYLTTIVVKAVFFALIFYNSIIIIPSLSKIESLNILTPLFVFLFLEAYFIVRLLQQNRN